MRLRQYLNEGLNSNALDAKELDKLFFKNLFRAGNSKIIECKKISVIDNTVEYLTIVFSMNKQYKKVYKLDRVAVFEKNGELVAQPRPFKMKGRNSSSFSDLETAMTFFNNIKSF